MGNYLKMDELETIRGLKRLGWSNRKISKETGHHRTTIAAVISHKTEGNNEVPPGGTFSSAPRLGGTSGSKSAAEPYKGIIEEQLEQGVTAKTIFHRLLYEHGYTGSYYSVKRYIRKLKRKTPELIGRMESAPGEEAQVDFGRGAPVINLITGTSRRPYLFKMVLACSRHSYEEVVWRQDTKTFIQCHINAFIAFGGVTKIVRIDNLKAGIIRCDWYDVIENPLYAEFARHYGFVILPCKPGVPRHKGKVENGIGYTQNALRGQKFENLEQQNQFLRNWNEKIARLRIHGSTQKQVWAAFEQIERPALQPLPLTPFEVFESGRRRVHHDGHVMVDYSYYSVPPGYLRTDVEVRWSQKLVTIYDNNRLIKTHPRSYIRGHWGSDPADIPAHLLPNQQYYRDFLNAKARKIGTDVIDWMEVMFRERGPRAFRVVQGVLNLKKKHTATVINDACRRAINGQITTYHGIHQLCEQKSYQDQHQGKLFSESHEFLRPPLEYQQLTEEQNAQPATHNPYNEQHGEQL